MKEFRKIALSALMISLFAVGCDKKKDDNTKALAIGAAALSASRSVGTSTSTSTVGAPSKLTYSGSPYSFLVSTAITTITPTVTGTVTSCTVSPTLPAGLSLNATTCAISGTPTTVQGATNYTVTASNSAGNTTATINILVSSDGSTWTSRTMPSSQVWQSVAYGNGVFVAVAGGHLQWQQVQRMG